MVRLECPDCKQVCNKGTANKIGSRYYCPSCGAYLGVDKPPAYELPPTWWRTTTGKRLMKKEQVG